MKKFLILIFILNIFKINVLAQKMPPPPPPLIYNSPAKSDLKEFIPEDKSFQITFSGIPTKTEKEVEKNLITTYKVYRQGSNSLVNVIEFEDNVEDIKDKIYELARNSYLKQPKSKIEAEKDIQLDGRPAKVFEVLRDY